MILALDPSSTCIGYALFAHDGVLFDAGRIRPPSAKADPLNRAQKMFDDVADLVKNSGTIHAVVVEIPSGKVHRAGRGRGMNGAGLSTYGMAVGYLIGRLVSRDDVCDRIYPVDCNVWTRGGSKEGRQSSVKARHKTYDPAKDSGMDTSDAICLGEWWITEQRVKAKVNA